MEVVIIVCYMLPMHLKVNNNIIVCVCLSVCTHFMYNDCLGLCLLLGKINIYVIWPRPRINVHVYLIGLG